MVLKSSPGPGARPGGRDAREGARRGSPSLREVFTNLIANAIEHNPRGGAVEVVASGDAPVRVDLRDRGPGVPEADRERIFRRFPVEDRPGGGSVFAFDLPTALRD